MTLSEKILYCRRKNGLSQEALAEKIGVSRQAISKWETGDATPEIGKLKALADAFCVTTDWLLSDAEPEVEAPAAAPEPQEKKTGAESTWVDALPGFVGTMIRRYGWLYGVYTALSGLGFVVIGTLARVLTRRMFSDFDVFDMGMGFDGGGVQWFDASGNPIAPPPGSEGLFPTQSSFAPGSPMMTFGAVVIAIGVVVIVAGVALAIYLKSRGKRD